MRRIACLLIAAAALAAPFYSQTQPAAAPALDPATTEAVLETDHGAIVIRFFPSEAPRHVDHFLKLVRQGFYDGLTFFRIIPYGIIQAGDPLTRDPVARERYGTGGLRNLQAEFNDNPCRRGAVAAVLVPGEPDSAGSQFFICVTDQLQLNRQYTVFGEVVSGMAAVEKISTRPADARQMATERIAIRRATLRPIPEPAFRGASAERLRRCRAIIRTDRGDIELALFPDVAPAHVRQFLGFAAAGLYDGTDFHRIVPGFVIQGGALAGRLPPVDEEYAGWLRPLTAEFSERPHERGTLSMARAEDPNSAMDSFFICLARQTSLDGKYTVFGAVTRGMEVVDGIAARARDDQDRPLERVAIRQIQVIEETQP
jgi:peptidyl-prolyl cis-trans isomerase B (cyclophilin B)